MARGFPKGSRLIDAAEGRNLFHHLPPSTIGADWKTASDDLAKAGEIGLDPVNLLGPSKGGPESGDDFIEEQDDPFFATDLSQPHQKSFFRKDNAHVSGNGLYDDAGNLVRILADQTFHIFQIIIGSSQGMFGQIPGNAQTVRNAKGCSASARLDEQAVAMTVVTAFKLEDLVSSGETPRHPYGADHSLGA